MHAPGSPWTSQSPCKYSLVFLSCFLVFLDPLSAPACPAKQLAGNRSSAPARRGLFARCTELWGCIDGMMLGGHYTVEDCKQFLSVNNFPCHPPLCGFFF